MKIKKTDTFKSGYDTAVATIIEFIERQQSYFRQQYSREANVVCNMLAREITEHFQCEKSIVGHTCEECKLPCGKNYFHGRCYSCNQKEKHK